MGTVPARPFSVESRSPSSPSASVAIFFHLGTYPSFLVDDMHIGDGGETVFSDCDGGMVVKALQPIASSVVAASIER